MSDKTQNVGRIIGDHMDEIAKLFVPGIRLTVIARNPEYPDGSQDMIVTADDIAAVITALQNVSQS